MENSLIQSKLDGYRRQAEILHAKIETLEELLLDNQQTKPAPSQQQITQKASTRSIVSSNLTNKPLRKQPTAISVKMQTAAVNLLADGKKRTLPDIMHTIKSQLQIDKIPPSTMRYILKREPQITKFEGGGYQIINKKNEEPENLF